MKFTKLSILLALATLLALNGCQPANGSNPSNQTTKGLPTLAENEAYIETLPIDTAKDAVCLGMTKAHLPCKAKPQAGSHYCYQHSPNSFRCGAITKGGTPCKMVVKVQGSKCHLHLNK